MLKQHFNFQLFPFWTFPPHSNLDNPTRFIASGQIFSIELISERIGRWDRYCLPSSSQSNPEIKNKFPWDLYATEYLNAGCVKGMVTLQSDAVVDFAQALETNGTLRRLLINCVDY